MSATNVLGYGEPLIFVGRRGTTFLVGQPYSPSLPSPSSLVETGGLPSILVGTGEPPVLAGQPCSPSLPSPTSLSLLVDTGRPPSILVGTGGLPSLSVAEQTRTERAAMTRQVEPPAQNRYPPVSDQNSAVIPMTWSCRFFSIVAISPVPRGVRSCPDVKNLLHIESLCGLGARGHAAEPDRRSAIQWRTAQKCELSEAMKTQWVQDLGACPCRPSEKKTIGVDDIKLIPYKQHPSTAVTPERTPKAMASGGFGL